MEPKRAGEVFSARLVHFGNQRGQGDAALIGDLLQHIPEFLLQRNAGGMACDDQGVFPHQWFRAAKKSLPLSSTMMKAGKSTTSMRQIASIPSSGYSSTSIFLMWFCASPAAAPPTEPR